MCPAATRSIFKAALLQTKRFVHRRLHRPAEHRAAAGDVDPVADRRCANSVPRREHRCVLLPGVAHRVVAFHLAEDLGLARHAADEEAAFTAHCPIAAAMHNQAMAARPVKPNISNALVSRRS